MYINKKVLFSLLIVFSFLFIAPLVYAASSSDFQTKAQKYVTNTCSKKILSNDQSLLCYLFYKTQEVQGQTTNNTNNISQLQTKVASVEATQNFDKFVNVCFDVSTGNIKVLQGNSCFPHVRWQIPVKCLQGEPCKPDNPQDLYYLNNN